MSPVIAIKTAIHTRLAADPALTALLGGTKIYDETPRGADTPYVVFGDVTCRDNGTVSDAGHRTELSLVVWSRHGGTREALAIGDALAGLLDDAVLPLAGHRMIACRIPVSETRAFPDKGLTRLILRLSIVTEVA